MKVDLLDKMRRGAQLGRREQIALVLRLSVPAILSQISTIIMEYIDASMVGSLGASASASIGIVATTTWLIDGLCAAIGIGFTVGIAHKIGAGDDKAARDHVKTGFLTVLTFAAILMGICILIHRQLPVWMGGAPEVVHDGSRYFLVFGLTLPLMQINYTGSGMLECSGNVRIPSILNVLMCFLDVLFNAFFIYPSRNVTLWGRLHLHLPGAGMGVTGAAVGTMCAVACGSAGILLAVLVFSPKLHLRRGEGRGLSFAAWKKALSISAPIMVSSTIIGSAYVVVTKIISPLGTIALAAHSFTITAESLGYMPGFGVAHAATTLVGQAKGAGRPDYEKHFGWLTTGIGMIVMAFSGVMLYIFAPQLIGIMTPDPAVRALGIRILRIEAFAEPLYGASIVAEGVFRGLGRTGVPSALNLFSIWCVRLPFSALFAGRFGLPGVWTVMCCELCLRGLLYILMMRRTFNAGRLDKKRLSQRNC